ncbi:cystathionine beta-lyase [Streptococcus sp. zg-JUN1979]|uniref:cystathionine beta-lyase n=1 Tax=Streptococcus sp. zg-JUN1979 TaxID=3391450 RepID=UPI0039A6E7DC
MTDYIDLALTYGGFTTLDKVYLTQCLKDLSHDDKLRFITPPPSVINAYFAEIYQKQSPKAATDYYFGLSKALKLYQKDPSFREEKPFVRLNLSGHSYGFAYISQEERAQVFAQEEGPMTESLFFEIAQLFPHYAVSYEEGRILLAPLAIDKLLIADETPKESLLTKVELLAGNVIRLSGLSREEIVELAENIKGQRYYQADGREALLYIKQEED